VTILVRFPVEGLTRQQHDEVSRRLEERGAWPPEGLLLHVLFGTEGDLKVSEMWESPEHLAAQSSQLLPALSEAGVKMVGEPEVFQVHAVEQPQTMA